ncbi:MAG: type I methionyl aminopeptidase [Candidatus Portnoybacteria bacterium RIFCSPHIGHO2_12_FULL_38_9]|uniref:Methionine aminopeptidase n=1 Tax=Candidatus Portnoybacteria bacterium RIFCSPHIGHO2_12_FULL_38_9 TaxID=1801997 RepID=A0A1G2FGS4_9BACT|nr:MAG: type I methionyl aminopeptidase [Candidatus Portnoybacteria bacterium RIFCSPHIGHO2_12_FULL_38_9]
MIPIKTSEEIKIMREGGRVLAKIMEELKSKAKPGISTQELNQLTEELVFKYGVKPAFKGYQGFPASLCVSLNEEIVHVAPSKRRLMEGDIVSLDLGILYKGFYLDMAITVPVGKISPEAGRLIRITKKALKRAIGRVKPGKHIGDISQTVESYVEGQGFNVVRQLCGHGIGRKLHEAPEIPNFGKRHKGPELKPGMVLAIEPMVTIGDWKLKKAKDGFGFETNDGSLSAHFEQTVAVTEKGGQVLTKL